MWTYILGLFNSDIFKHGIKYLIIVCVCFVMGFTYGKYSERLAQVRLSLKAATEITKGIEAHQLVVNKILAEKEIKLVNITRENTELKEGLKRDEKIINATNVIRRNFVRHVSATNKHSVPKATGTIARTNESSPDLGTVPAARVGNYIIDLKTHDDTCVLQLNALIKSIN